MMQQNETGWVKELQAADCINYKIDVKALIEENDRLCKEAVKRTLECNRWKTVALGATFFAASVLVCVLVCCVLSR